MKCITDSALQTQKRHVVGYFDSDTSPDFKVYHKVASVLRDDCTFHAAIGSEPSSLLLDNRSSHCISQLYCIKKGKVLIIYIAVLRNLRFCRTTSAIPP